MEFKSQHYMEDMQQRVEAMLNSLMPQQIVDDIRRRGDMSTISHPYEHVTMAQSDMVGFTQLASGCTPSQVVGFITELFGRFDAIADAMGIYKVETVGDAYQAGMAEKLLTDKNSPTAVVLFGVEMIRTVNKWAKSKDPPLSVTCRVGVHHGACVGGVVGKRMQRYHLFGDLMRVLEVLESTGPRGGVQVSGACKAAVDDERKFGNAMSLESFELSPRAVATLRTSKGEEHSYDEVGGETFLVVGPEGILGDA
jgi:guanylate cyclase soluble subunit beta